MDSFKEQVKQRAKQFWYWIDGESTSMKVFVGAGIAFLIMLAFCD
jgi:hypothetical protein